MTDSPVRPGDVLAGKYRVERVLGVGGMGVVVAATHLELGTFVALKFMLVAHAENATAAERFTREARAAARLRSEHVTRVHDVGKLENGAPYIVMEFLEGSDLDELVMKKGSLPASEAIEFVIQACEAISEAHSVGIVHRDLKPQNLFLTKRPDGSPFVKVLDFGISKMQEGEGALSTTSTGMVLGSPVFMSPEQIRSAKHVDARTDIYALGGILYRLLSGQFPYDAESVGELFAQVFTASPRPLSKFVPTIDPALEAIVIRCLAREPQHRFQTVGELVNALRPFRSAGYSSLSHVRSGMAQQGVGYSTGAAAPPPSPSTGGRPPTTTLGQAAGAISQAQEAPRARLGLWIALGAGGFVVVAGLAAVLLVVVPRWSAAKTAAAPSSTDTTSSAKTSSMSSASGGIDQ